MSSSNLVRVAYKKETGSYGSTPVATKASKVIQDITLTAVKGGSPGNLFSVEKITGASAGSETVVITGKKITINIASGSSTATEVMTALTAQSAALATLGVSFALTGVGSNAQTALAVANFTGGSGEFQDARFTSEKYSGTPDTTESAQIRTDRMSSGQVVTGLKVDGGHSFELAKEQAIEDFMQSAMFNSWFAQEPVTGTFHIDVTSGIKIERSAGNFSDEGVVVGDFIQLSDFSSDENNVIVMVMDIQDSGETLLVAAPAGMAAATAESATYQVCDKLSIGVTKNSLTVEKTFLDLTTKGLIYRGCLVAQMEIKVEYGSLISGSFDTSGNDYEAVDAAEDFASYGEFLNDPATTDSMNGSVDMPFVATNVTGDWAQDQFCLQSVDLQLNNNLTVQNCIGKAAPQDYSPGTSDITVSLSSYLKDTNWELLAKKLSQEPFALGFLVQNIDGFYAFYMPAIQVSFDDPQSGGANQEISMDMKGTCKVGANGESSLTIYRAPTL